MNIEKANKIVAKMTSELEKRLSKSEFKHIKPYATEIAQRHASRLTWLEEMAKNKNVEKHQYERSLLAERDIYQIELGSLAGLSRNKAKKISKIMSDTLRSTLFASLAILL
ncbi:MAG: hypothetical protein ACK5L5_05395 [Bacteroidales bacterium]